MRGNSEASLRSEPNVLNTDTRTGVDSAAPYVLPSPE